MQAHDPNFVFNYYFKISNKCLTMDLNNTRAITKKGLTWEEFDNLLRDKYMFECYYDNKAKEFYELKMGEMTSNEYITNFLGLLRYVAYIKDEKVKIHRFFSGMPMVFRDKIEC